MPRYEYKCPLGHLTEAIAPISAIPSNVLCTTCPDPTAATRVYSAPAAIHFKGPGFYATDVKGRLNRRRRPNPGDDLHKEFDHGAARIADAI